MKSIEVTVKCSWNSLGQFPYTPFLNHFQGQHAPGVSWQNVDLQSKTMDLRQKILDSLSTARYLLGNPLNLSCVFYKEKPLYDLASQVVGQRINLSNRFIHKLIHDIVT